MKVDVRIYSDRIEVVGDGKSATARPAVPYVGQRVLVGSFQPAVDCLYDALKEIGIVGVLKKRPALRLRAMEMNKGGLSEVEERCLREVALAAGAGSVEVE